MTSISDRTLNAPFLRNARDFPPEVNQLSIEVNKTYLDIANSVNNRTVSIFPSDRPVSNGESWYLTRNKKQAGFRQVYPFLTFTSPLTIPHGINLTLVSGIVRVFGTATDGTIWYPLPYVDIVSATNQINVIVNQTNIIITAGAGAPPAITSGYIVLEWISNV